jgi:hypothetical protein
MGNTESLNTLCPACDGPISFEAYRLGERVNCPHCQEMIELGSVAPLPAQPDAPFQTTAAAPSTGSGFKLLACAAALVVLLAGGVFFGRRVAANQPKPKSQVLEVVAKAKETSPVQPPVALPTPPAMLTPPPPKTDDALAEQARQQQEQANQQQLIAELRRANDLAEANARWQQWKDIQSRAIAESQPREIIEPVEVFEPVEMDVPIPAFQQIEIIQSPIGGVYNGGLKSGRPIVRGLPGSVGQRGHGVTTLTVNATPRTLPYGN